MVSSDFPGTGTRYFSVLYADAEKLYLEKVFYQEYVLAYHYNPRGLFYNESKLCSACPAQSVLFTNPGKLLQCMSGLQYQNSLASMLTAQNSGIWNTYIWRLPQLRNIAVACQRLRQESTMMPREDWKRRPMMEELWLSWDLEWTSCPILTRYSTIAVR